MRGNNKRRNSKRGNSKRAEFSQGEGMGEVFMRIRFGFLVIVVLAAVLLAGCGGSSKTSSSRTNASAATATTGKPAGLAEGRFAALSKCMQKNGIPLPPPTPGQLPTLRFL